MWGPVSLRLRLIKVKELIGWKSLRNHPSQPSILQIEKLRLEGKRKQLTQGLSMSCRIARPRFQVFSVEPGALSTLCVIPQIS